MEMPVRLYWAVYHGDSFVALFTKKGDAETQADKIGGRVLPAAIQGWIHAGEWQ